MVQSFGRLKYKIMLCKQAPDTAPGPLQTFVVGKNGSRKTLQVNLLQTCSFAIKSG